MIPAGYEMAFALACLLVAASILLIIPGSFGRQGDLLSIKNLAILIYGSIYGVSTIDRILNRTNVVLHEAERLTEIMTIALIGLGAFAIGYFGVKVRGLSRLIPSPPSVVSPRKYQKVVGALIFIALASAAILEILVGGIINRLLNPLALRNTAEIDWWYFYLQWGLILIQVAVWFVLAYRISRGQRRISLGAVVLLLLAVSLSFTQNRTLVINLVFPILFLIHNHIRRIRMRHVIVIAVLGLSYFFVWDVYRSASTGRDLVKDFSLQSIYDGLMANLDYIDSLLRASAKLSDDAAFQNGSTYLSLVFKPIPRSIWVDKPLGGNSALTTMIDPYAFSLGFSRAASVVTEAFINFGWLGVPFVLFLVGVVCKVLMSYRRRHQQNPLGTVLYSVCAIGVTMFVRVDAQVASTFLIYYGVPILISWHYCAQLPYGRTDTNSRRSNRT